MLVAAGGLEIGGVVAIVSLTAAGVGAFLRVRGDTREAVDKQADKRVAEMRSTADHFREAYEATVIEAREQREQKHKALTELADLRLKTDLTAFMKLVADRFDAIDRRFESMTRTQEQTVQELTRLGETQQAQIEALHAITDRLNGR